MSHVDALQSYRGVSVVVEADKYYLSTNEKKAFVPHMSAKIMVALLKAQGKAVDRVTIVAAMYPTRPNMKVDVMEERIRAHMKTLRNALVECGLQRNNLFPVGNGAYLFDPLLTGSLTPQKRT